MRFFKKYKLALLGITLGSLAGYLYYTFYGCTTGSCAITSNPLHSIIYGASMGGLLFSSFKKESTDQPTNK